ncbi:MAG: AI-2E family transporter [Clostridia bacterium]|nr:AI-2E family transporter [Clostridia bacterium]
MSKDTFKKCIWLITFAIILYLALHKISEIGALLRMLLNVSAPVLFGTILAFLLNIPLRFLEERVFAKLWKKAPKLARFKRGICMVLTYILVLAVVSAVLAFALTQLSTSISKFVSEVPDYMKQVEAFVVELAARFDLSEQIWRGWVEQLGDLWSLVSNYASDVVTFVYKLVSSTMSGVFTVLIGLIFSVYALASKERLCSIFTRLKQAYLPQKARPMVDRVFSEGYQNLTNFFGGQLIEALIVGVLCLVGMLILRLPYAPLVSTIVAVTNIIPIFGPWIGGAFAAVIILLENPVQALIFLIFVVVLQQFESNLIYPRVVGRAVGLSGIWVFVAITLGGGLFGLAGMLFAVPVMATLYDLLSVCTNDRLAMLQVRAKRSPAAASSSETQKEGKQ